jgi:ribbon-helix-helix CopG family protein
MRRTTISLPEEIAELLGREAKRRGQSVSEIVRSALLEHFAIAGGKKKLPFVGLGRSGRKNTARNAEAILAKEWGGGARRR